MPTRGESENMLKWVNKKVWCCFYVFVPLFKKVWLTLDKLCKMKKQHPPNCGYVVCTLACWTIKTKPRAVTFLTHSSISVCGVSACCFSGEHWSSIMTFVEKALSTMDSLVLCHTCYQVYTTQEQNMNMPASRVILPSFFFSCEVNQVLSLDRGKNPLCWNDI